MIQYVPPDGVVGGKGGGVWGLDFGWGGLGDAVFLWSCCCDETLK